MQVWHHRSPDGSIAESMVYCQALKFAPVGDAQIVLPSRTEPNT